MQSTQQGITGLHHNKKIHIRHRKQQRKALEKVSKERGRVSTRLDKYLS